MDLPAYIRSVGKDAAVGALVGLDRTTISRIRRGLIDPPFSTAREIVARTGGKLLIEQPAAGDAASVATPAPHTAGAGA